MAEMHTPAIPEPLAPKPISCFPVIPIPVTGQLVVHLLTAVLTRMGYTGQKFLLEMHLPTVVLFNQQVHLLLNPEP